jgi:hypothetical protein
MFQSFRVQLIPRATGDGYRNMKIVMFEKEFPNYYDPTSPADLINPSTDPTNSPTDTTKPPIDPTHWPTQSTHRPTQPTNRPIQGTHRTTQPTRWPTQPTHWRTQPTQRPVQPLFLSPYGESYKLWCISLCSFLNSPITIHSWYN